MDNTDILLTIDGIYSLYSEARQKKRVKVPKGTSDYQAAWIIDDAEQGEDDNDFESCDDDDEEEDGMMEDEIDGDNESQVGFLLFVHMGSHRFLMWFFHAIQIYKMYKIDPGELCKSEGFFFIIVLGRGSMFSLFFVFSWSRAWL